MKTTGCSVGRRSSSTFHSLHEHMGCTGSSVVAGWARVVGEVPGTVLSSRKTIGQEDILQMV